jgi:hypothetical protein
VAFGKTDKYFSLYRKKEKKRKRGLIYSKKIIGRTKRMVTWVTAYFHLSENEGHGRTMEWRLTNFLQLAKTGMKLIVFCCDKSLAALSERLKGFNNVIIDNTIHRLEDLIAFKQMERVPDLTMPSYRTPVKDTRQYMTLINSKLEFVKRAINLNPYGSKNYAWVDFSLPYVFKNGQKTLDYFTKISDDNDWPLYVAGSFETKSVIIPIDGVHWRFSGGIFMGNKTKMMEFADYHEQHFPDILEKYKKVLWEVNVWALYEQQAGFVNVIWYKGASDDKIIENLPALKSIK